MAIQAPDAVKDELLRDNQKLRNAGELLANKLMITSQRINLPGESGPYQDKTTRKGNQETEGQKLDKKNPTYTEGGIIDTGELDSGGKPLMIKGNPLDDATLDKGKFRGDARQRKIRNLVDEGATKGEQDAARGKLKDQTQLPKFFKAIIDAKPNPADLLKILQLLPAFTGGGLGQMASPNYKRDTQIYGERDRILNPDGKFNKPTLDMIREHASRYRV